MEQGTLMINGIDYSDKGSLIVNGVNYSRGGIDVSDTTAIEEDVASGKVFYKANGSRAVGILENLYSKCASGDVNNSTSGRVTIDVGFRPKLIIALQTTTAGVPSAMNIYDENLGNFVTRNVTDVRELPNTNDNRMGDVTDTGFVMNKISNTTVVAKTYYWAFA